MVLRNYQILGIVDSACAVNTVREVLGSMNDFRPVGRDFVYGSGDEALVVLDEVDRLRPVRIRSEDTKAYESINGALSRISLGMAQVLG